MLLSKFYVFTGAGHILSASTEAELVSIGWYLLVTVGAIFRDEICSVFYSIS